MRGRAFTLLEVLLAATLSLLALTLLVQILIPLLHSFAWTSARAELLQATSLASRYLVGDVQRSPMRGLVLPTPAHPGLLSVHGVSDLTDTGRAVWAPQLIVYRWEPAQRSLTRKVWPPGPPNLPALSATTPLRPTPDQMMSILDQSNSNRKKLVNGLLTHFALIVEGAHLQLTLETEAAVPGRPPETYRLVQSLALRNGAR